MNRAIITPAKIAATDRDQRQIRAKINKAKIGALLDSDLETHHPAASQLRAERLTTSGTDSMSVKDLLNLDIDARTADILRNKRIELLKKNMAPAPKVSDTYLDKLVKYIPTEVIAFYLALTSQLVTLPEGKRISYAFGLVVGGSIITFFYLRRITHVSNTIQILISCIAFVAWAIGLSDYIVFDGKALLIPVITFIIPFINPPEPAAK
jgi:hypothetical protein